MLILASTSAYRRELLSRLGLPFACEAPGIDETLAADEPAAAAALRLARAKALAVAGRHPGATVIGSDQVVEAPDGGRLGKPGTPDAACAQLARLAGKAALFHTAVAVVGGNGTVATESVATRVQFRPLAPAAIRRYVAREAVLDCAGSFKAEGLGIVLFERIASDDPTALIGLPLIATARLLRAAGIDPLAETG